jgi:nucleoid-associated protein YgaU
MREFLKIFEIGAPYHFVLFDHNPEQLKITRAAKNMGTSFGRSTGGGSSGSGGAAGSSGVVNRGNEPTKMTITKARLVGPECKPMCDRLLSWLSPRKMNAIEMAATALMTGGFITPILLVQWGPPLMGFTFQAQLTSVTIDYVRVSALGIPTHATALLQLQEYPQIVSLTNPTSGGRPGRNRHMVTSHETLASIATDTFGNPNAWRAIADINDIDDPTSIRPGDIVYLPAPEELAELVGGRR